MCIRDCSLEILTFPSEAGMHMSAYCNLQEVFGIADTDEAMHALRPAFEMVTSLGCSFPSLLSAG